MAFSNDALAGAQVCFAASSRPFSYAFLAALLACALVPLVNAFVSEDKGCKRILPTLVLESGFTPSNGLVSERYPSRVARNTQPFVSLHPGCKTPGLKLKRPFESATAMTFSVPPQTA